MKCLQDLSYNELEELVVGKGFPKFRAGQFYDLVNRHKEYDEATNLPKALIEDLSTEYFATSLEIVERLVGREGTEKY
ncbi:MAG: 23S rRNA (adenine(2503)-C(2))-methyltransferase RlmN, partial [Clostridia bacterium]|nr:23S rRNA (adenine(2503)-C(2))-methyltransferase RlmN [Clostridia bacterium]